MEIQLPSSVEAPSAPWMSASDALVIWMSRIAVNAPRIAPNTASQSRALAFASGAAGRGAGRGHGRQALIGAGPR